MGAGAVCRSMVHAGRVVTLFDSYSALARPDAGVNADYVVAETEVGGIYVGKGPRGEAALIIENRSDLETRQVRIELEAFTAYRNRRVALTGVSKGTLGALTIEVSESELIPRFYELCGLLIESFKLGNETETWRFVETMARIFRARTTPARTELVGFLGELLYIYASSSRNASIEAWRDSEVGLFDFQYETGRLDVKTTSAVGRRHVLAMDQVSPIQGVCPFFASVQLREGGREDVSSILKGIVEDPSLSLGSRIRLEERVAVALGREHGSAQTFTFDLAEALGSIRIFSASEVPKISVAPVGVTGVRFVSDFDFADSSLSLEDFEKSRALHLER